MTPVENNRQTPEQPKKLNIHELGSLTRPQWGLVVAKIGTVYSEVKGQIALYATRAALGPVRDKHFQARGYLGREHWKAISYVFQDAGNIIETDQGSLDTSLNQAVLYAKLEGSLYTMADLIRIMKDRLHAVSPYGEHMQSYRHYWDEDENVWKSTGRTWDQREGFIPGQNNPDVQTAEYGTWAENETVSTSEANESELRNIWMVTSEEVPDIIHTSPRSLEKTLHQLGQRILPLIRQRMGYLPDSQEIDVILNTPTESKKAEALAMIADAYQKHFQIEPLIRSYKLPDVRTQIYRDLFDLDQYAIPDATNPPVSHIPIRLYTRKK